MTTSKASKRRRRPVTTARTTTPTYNIDVTVGGNFAEGRGNAVVSVNYLNRGSITRGERGEWAFYSLSDGCVTLASVSRDQPGVRVEGLRPLP